MRKALTRGSSTFDRPSEFFVESQTPTLGNVPARVQRAVTMGDAQVDFLDTSPEIKLKLLARRLLFYVGTTLLFYGAFSVVAYIGVPVETIYEPIGTSKKSEERVETYNTYSGYVMAFLETLLGMYMSKFLPVVDVYAHNALYFLQRASTTIDPATGQPKPASKISRTTHRAILFFLPIAIALTMGNSMRGLQAGSSSEGFKHIMVTEDLKKEQPTLELVKEKKKKNATALAGAPQGRNVQDTILRNAIRAQSAPFMFYTKSPCGSDGNDTASAIASAFKVTLDVHDLDATSAVYGFVPQEWNGEALSHELQPTSSFHITYKEALAAAEANKTLTLPTEFSLATAFEVLIQGKLVIERAQGDAATEKYDCSLSDDRVDEPLEDHSANSSDAAGNNTNTAKAARNLQADRPRTLPKSLLNHVMMRTQRRRLEESQSGSAAEEESVGLEEDEEEEDTDIGLDGWTVENGVRKCEGAVSSLFDMLLFDSPEARTLNILALATGELINKTMGNLAVEETEITFEKYKITNQIYVEAMRIDIPVVDTMDYGLNPNSTYLYNGLEQFFCGSEGCAFLDAAASMKFQREIGIVPYVVNCTLDRENVHYSSDFRGYYPNNCTKVENAALLYGLGTYISGDEYGSHDTTDGSQSPYIKAPRRHMRFTFAKVTWQTEDLAAKFNAKCRTDKDNADCNGLWLQLEQSNRFLFAGRDALPTKALAKADFRSPISLVQLNSPTLYVKKFEQEITLEPLNPGNFKSVKWDKTPYTTKAKNGSTITGLAALRGAQCSMFIDSYLKQVSDNHYEIERPMQVMYTSFFYYLMQNAAVTELNDTSIALNGTTTAIDLNGTTIEVTKAAADAKDRFGNVKLKGDMQVRSIRVSIPKDSVKTTFAGCALILVLMLLVVFVPARRVEHFDEGASTALQFVAMRSDEAYPDSVHKKTLLFPATNEVVAFDELEVERMVLVHETERDKKVYL